MAAPAASASVANSTNEPDRKPVAVSTKKRRPEDNGGRAGECVFFGNFAITVCMILYRGCHQGFWVDCVSFRHET